MSKEIKYKYTRDNWIINILVKKKYLWNIQMYVNCNRNYNLRNIFKILIRMSQIFQ
jgi:hypothetical protein